MPIERPGGLFLVTFLDKQNSNVRPLVKFTEELKRSKRPLNAYQEFIKERV